MPTTQLSAKLTAASARRRIDCSTAFAITGLKTLSSKWPWLPAKATVVALPITCAQTMVMASAWVGLTLPGMIEEPGSFSGSAISPMPERGPEPIRRMSLAILNSPAARLVERAVREDERVVRGERLELVRRRREGQAGQLRDLRRRTPRRSADAC